MRTMWVTETAWIMLLDNGKRVAKVVYEIGPDADDMGNRNS